ncbi:hypothetical protein B0F90DRAFT_1687243 [Multifurca ochricompacta]|uniref:Uncharacterized protein n=1 Tax=Multifurca ochricompacta TaxID=376703 RepID=A0AAD4MCE9_9AGAM|nr:hypothetical protein B0F90DRAFT_1687243 [Multifurca ochricompacta]
MAASIAPSNSRGMSWRKPVPAFIPSPPASRPTSDDLFIPSSIASGENGSKRPTARVSQDGPPPVPDNWRTIIGNATQDLKRDSNHSQRGAGIVISEPEPVYVEISRAASSTMDDFRSHSNRCHYQPKGSFPKIYRPPTPPIPSVRRPKSLAVPSVLQSQPSLVHPYRMIYPDPPSLIMKDSFQTLRHSSAPSLCVSEFTRPPASVTSRPSVQSMTSSDGHTAVSSHAEMGSWYLPDDLQAEWDLGLALGLQNEKKAISRTNGKSELPMHYIPTSKFKKMQKQRSCSGFLWYAMASFGRAITSVFKTMPVDS